MQGRRRRQWPGIKAALIQTWVKQKKSFLKVPTPKDGFNTDSARPRSTTSGEASRVWEDGLVPVLLFIVKPSNLLFLRDSDSKASSCVYCIKLDLVTNIPKLEYWN